MNMKFRLYFLTTAFVFLTLKSFGQSCCDAHGGLGCGDLACQTAICNIDAWCCTNNWDALCAADAVNNANAGGPCANTAGCPGGTGGGTGCAAVAPVPNDNCYQQVIAADPFCCNNTWDALCQTAYNNCTPTTLTASFNASSTQVCVGETITFTDNSSGSITSYNWVFNNGNPANATTQGPHVITFNSTGTYTIELTVGDGTDTDATSITITVNDLPNIVASNNDEICQGENITISATGGNTYTWDNGLGAGNSHTVSPANSTTYTVTGTDANGCINTDQVTIDVLPAPNVNAGIDQTICNGESAQIEASGASSYSWDSGLGSGVSHTVSPTSTTTYTVTGTGANGCEATDQVTINVSNGPSVNFNVSDVLCFGGSTGEIEVIATGDGPFTYNWQGSGSTSNPYENLSLGNYTVTVTDINGCETETNTSVNEPSQLLLDFNSTEPTCNENNGEITVSASNGTGPYTYLWSHNGQTTSTITNLAAGTYSVTVTDANGCELSESVILNASDAPQIDLLSLTNISCFGENDGSISVNVSGGTPPYNYSWNPTVSGQTSIENLGPGNYELSVEDDDNCIASQTFTINEPPALSVNANTQDADCGVSNGLIDLTIVGGTSPYTVDWGSTGLSGTSNSNLPAGNYNLTVFDNNGCTQEINLTIDALGDFPGSITLNQNSYVIELGSSVNFNPNIQSSAPNFTIDWTPQSGLSCTNCPNPTASPTESTEYTLTVSIDGGCTISENIFVEVIQPCKEVFVPNRFSPNNDGKNDELCIYGDCVTSLDFTIFNRWGEVVFKTNDLTNCWSGNFKGRRLNTGVYAYKLQATLISGETINQNGNIKLLR